MATLISIEAPVVTGLLDATAVAALEKSLNVASLAEGEAAMTLRTIDSTINRLQGLRLKAVAASARSRAGAADGLAGVSAWVARESRLGGAEAARSVRLASSLESLPHAGRALGEGSISVQHAEVIASATKQLPPDLSPVERDRVETVLTEQARRVDPVTLRKVSRRAVEIAGRTIVEADAHENQVVRTAEEIALLKTRLSMHDNDDGTISGHFLVPAFAGSVLRKAIQAITAPRRAAIRAAQSEGRTWTKTEDHAADWSHQYGLAFVELLEHLPTDRLHSKVAATVVVTIGLGQLCGQLKAVGADTGHDISAEKARQLACNAGIVPAVLGGTSVPLNLGREKRLFSEAQRVALATRYDSCAAAGCDRPFAWSELHHQQPWQHGGVTDLDQAIPLCSFHHRMIHDEGYRHDVTQRPMGIKRVIFRRSTGAEPRRDRPAVRSSWTLNKDPDPLGWKP